VRADGTTTTTTTTAPVHKHHHLIQFILNHAAQLGLTTTQQSQLQALQAKIKQHLAQNNTTATTNTTTTSQHHHWLWQQIQNILTPTQIQELKTLLKQCHQNHTAK
jgi:hypothetical protein